MPELTIVAYHYVRDLPRTPYPKIKGLLTDRFVSQLEFFQANYEMATQESVLSYLDGAYVPTRNMCYLTFDDGFKDHFDTVLPILTEHKVEGAFFPVTDCIEFGWVAPVHKNHFLMAAVDFEELKRRSIEIISSEFPDQSLEVDRPSDAYELDTPEVADYKYLMNVTLPPNINASVMNSMFAQVFGDEAKFAEGLYLSWSELSEMQNAGMRIGGHTRKHKFLSKLESEDQSDEIITSLAHMRQALAGC